MPAEELEQKAAHILRQHINRVSFIEDVTPNPSASAIEIAKAKLQVLCASKDIKPSLDLVERIVLSPGQLNFSINAEKLGTVLEHDLEDIPQDQLSITAPFQLRKRGVETKLVFADALPDRDDTLIQNIAKAHDWYQQVKAGKTLSEVARANNTSYRRIQQMIE